MNISNSIKTEVLNIEIRSYSPSEVITFAESNPQVADHIIRGDNVTDNIDPLEVVRDEFDHGEDRTRVFLALVDGKVVGSLYFILWRNNYEDKRGGKLKRFLEDHGQDLIDLEKLNNYDVLACDIGIVIDPDYQGKGIVNKLYEQGITETKPAFLVGQTKMPAAVIARTRILNAMGFKSSYGGKSLDLSSEIAQLLAEAYYFARADVSQRIDGKNVHYASTEAHQPDINVNFSKLPSEFAEVFRDIIEADKNRPEGKITFAPLVSIDKNLLK